MPSSKNSKSGKTKAMKRAERGDEPFQIEAGTAFAKPEPRQEMAVSPGCIEMQGRWDKTLGGFLIFGCRCVGRAECSAGRTPTCFTVPVRDVASDGYHQTSRVCADNAEENCKLYRAQGLSVRVVVGASGTVDKKNQRDVHVLHGVGGVLGRGRGRSRLRPRGSGLRDVRTFCGWRRFSDFSPAEVRGGFARGSSS